MPDSITRIGVSTFYNSDKLTRVVFSDNVEVIGSGCFAGCTSLTYISPMSKVNVISDWTFQGCSSLTNIILPMVKEISNSAFRECDSMCSFSIGGKTISDYSDDDLVLVDGAGQIQEGNGLKTIKNDGFLTQWKYVNPSAQSRPSLKSMCAFGNIVLPNFINQICERGFEQFTSIESLHTSSDNLIFNSLAFSSCYQLRSIDLGGNVSFHDDSFSECSAINSITYKRSTFATSDEDTVIVKNNGDVVFGTDSTTININQGGFFTKRKYVKNDPSLGLFCPSHLAIGDITIPNVVTKLGNEAFLNCTNLTLVNLNNTTTIDNGFISCSSLKSINFRDNTIIEGDAFGGCSSLEILNLGNSSDISENAFQNCPSLNSITYKRSTFATNDEDTVIVKNNGDVVFGTDSTTISINQGGFFTKLKYVKSTETVTDIICSFKNLAIGDITIPNIVVNVGDMAFRHCHLIRSLNLGNNIVSIGNDSFLDCLSLTHINLNSVGYINEGAFSGCHNLNQIISNFSTLPWMSSNWNNEFFGTSPLGGNVHNNGSVSSENVLNFFKQHGLPNTWTSL